MVERVPPESVPESEALAEAPSWAASLTIKTRDTSLVARGQASVTAAAGIVGISCAALTSYIASQAPPHAWPWFLGVAAMELAVAALTIIRITKPSQRRGL